MASEFREPERVDPATQSQFISLEKSRQIMRSRTAVRTGLGSPQRLLVARTDRLGDVVLSLPAVEALRRAYPSAAVDLLVRPYTAPLARLQRSVRRVETDDLSGLRGLPALVSRLKRSGYDAVFHLHPCPRLALAAVLAGIPVRIGTRYRFYAFLFNRRIALHRAASGLHERDLNLLLLEGAGVPTDGVETGIEVPDPAKLEVQRMLCEAGLDKSRPVAVLHPGSGGSSLAWPPDRFAELARLLTEAGYPVVVTGSSWEKPLAQIVQSATPCGALDLAGRLDLVRLAALLEQADILVSNSTGPLHLADALGTRVVGLYSPFLGATPDRWAPYHQKENAILPQGPICPRCKGPRCSRYNCLAEISSQAVFDRVLSVLGQSPSAGSGQPRSPRSGP